MWLPVASPRYLHTLMVVLTCWYGVAIGCGAVAAPRPCPCQRPDYILALDENFDVLQLQRNGGPGRWGTTGDGANEFRVGNRTLPHERELYVDQDAIGALHLPAANYPFAIENGILSITATPLPATARETVKLDYSSGLLVTRNSFLFQYGYMEVRAKLPVGRGLWPAIWLFRPGQTYGEIDVLENLGQQPDRFYSTIHYQVADASGASHVDQKLVVDRTGPDLSADFHLYAVDWTEQDVRFLLDGVEVGRAATPDALKAPMYILLNLAVGGEGSWPGPVGPETRFPASLQIDDVKVWTRGGTFTK